MNQVKDCDPGSASIPFRRMLKRDSGSTSYADAGVSIERGDELVSRIKQHAARTARPGMLGGIGGFAGLFDVGALGYSRPVLVAGTDGAGTKIKLAIDAGRHDTIGIDLVAMCVNDVLVQGAQPVFFLDYYVCGKLDVDVAEQVVCGIAAGCRIAGCTLLGGETAEHPGQYGDGDYDLAGFCVGAVEKADIIDGSGIRAGDMVVAVASSGAHSNGYSLIRKLLADTGTRLADRLGDETFADALLRPTRIYVKPVLALLEGIRVKGIAHITGGGITENVPRILPDALGVEIDCGTWKRDSIFQWIRQAGNVSIAEMYRTFNCGVGMILVVDPADAGNTADALRRAGEHAWIAGTVVARKDGSRHSVTLAGSESF